MDIRTISGAAYSRPVAPFVGSDASLPAEVAKSADSAAPFFSPVYRFDPVAKLSILSFRDATTGAIVQQIPNEKVVEQYRRSGGENPEVKPVATTAEPANSVAPTAEAAKAPAVAPDTGITTPLPTGSSAKAAPAVAAPAIAASAVAAPEPASPAPVASL